MKKILLVTAMALALSACDMRELEFNEHDRQVAEQRCSSVGGTIYFSNYQSSGNPFWASCFVQGFKYRIDKDGSMLK